MDKKSRYLAPPTYTFGTKSPVLFEGWKFGHGDAYGGSWYPCIVCQVSKPRLFHVLMALIEQSKLLVASAEWEDILHGEGDGGLGFFGCRLTRFDMGDGIVDSRYYNDIEPATLYSVLGKFFDDLYRDGFISMEISPLCESYHTPFVIHLTRGMLIRVSAFDPDLLMEFVEVLEEVGLRRYKRLRLADSLPCKYRPSEHTKLMWRDLVGDLNPRSRRFDRGGSDDGDSPQGV